MDEMKDVADGAFFVFLPLEAYTFLTHVLYKIWYLEVICEEITFQRLIFINE